MAVANLFKFVLPVVILGGAVAGFDYLRASKPEQPRPQPREKTWVVDVTPALPARHAPSVKLYGRVEAPASLQPAAPGPGVVETVRVRDGQRVREGDLLVALDPRDFEPAAAQARADVADLRAQIDNSELTAAADARALAEEQRLLELARRSVARARQMQRQRLASESTLEDAEQGLVRQQLALNTRQLAVDTHAARLAQLQARLQRAEADLAQARLALDRSRVSAPFDAVVGEVHVAGGDRVQTSQPLLSLYPLDDLEVRARIPARYQDEIQAALDAGRRLEARTVRAGAPLALTLVRLAGHAEANGIDGFFRVDAAGAALRPGNLIELRLQRPAQDGLIAVPFQAVYGNARLYLLRGERMFGIDVQVVGSFVDEAGDEALLVRSPEIASGDEIVVTHLPNAVSGLKVRPARSGAGERASGES